MNPSWWWSWLRVWVTEKRFVKMNIRVRNRNATTRGRARGARSTLSLWTLHSAGLAPLLPALTVVVARTEIFVFRSRMGLVSRVHYYFTVLSRLTAAYTGLTFLPVDY